MKATIIKPSTDKQLNHMISCLSEEKLAYRLLNTITGIPDIEIYHNTKSEIVNLKRTFEKKLQTSLF